MTNGITEPRNADGVMYEESVRLNEVYILPEMSIKEVVDTIINDVGLYSGWRARWRYYVGSGQGELISLYSLNKLIGFGATV